MTDPGLVHVAEQLRVKLAAAELRVQRLRSALREVQAVLTEEGDLPSGRTRAASRGGSTVARGPSTGTALLAVLGQDGDSRTWTAHELAVELTGRGWASTSNDPANAVRTALGRLLQDGRIVRVGPGRYRVSDHARSDGESVGRPVDDGTPEEQDNGAVPEDASDDMAPDKSTEAGGRHTGADAQDQPDEP